MNKSDLKKILAVSAVAAAAAAAAVVVIKHHRDKALAQEHTEELLHKNAYIAGGGLSAYAAALYLVRDCGLKSENVHVFTNSIHNIGGAETGYICRRGKLLDEKKSLNFFDLMNEVRSLDIPDLTVCDEILNIYKASPALRNITLIDENEDVIDISKIRIDKEYRKIITELIRSDAQSLNTALICDILPQEFFETDFWKLISAAYGFSNKSSAYEFAKCIFYADDIFSGTLPGAFDRNDEIIEPLKAHILKLGVDVRTKAVVTDIDFEDERAESIHFTDDGIRKTFHLNEGDICIIPTDEMSNNESFGNFNSPAPKSDAVPFELWEKLAQKSKAFKKPEMVFDEFDGDMSQEFTITLSNRLLPELIDKVTCNALGTDGIIVLDNSNWKMTICAVPATHFKNLSEDISIIWGTASRYDREGERSGKPMTECSGAEILYELVSCFNLDEAWDDIRETVINVIPCHRKYDKSYLSPAEAKLEIIPTGISNLAISGDFVNYENNTVFSEEYSVSTARKAAYRLMHTKRKIYTPTGASCRSIKKKLKSLSRN